MNVCSNIGRMTFGRLFHTVHHANRRNTIKIIRHFSNSQPIKKNPVSSQSAATATSNQITVASNVKEPNLEHSQFSRPHARSTLYSNSDDSEIPTNQNSYLTESQKMLLGHALQECMDSEVLLQMSVTRTLTLKQACLLISNIGRLVKMDKVPNVQNVLNDKRFIGLCNIVQRGNHLQSPQSLLLAIYGFQDMGDQLQNSELLQTLKGEFRWSIRRCPVRLLSRAIGVFSAKGEIVDEECSGNDEISLLNASVDTLQRRWVEVATGIDFLLAFKIIHHLDGETKGNLEDRAVEMVQEFTTMEIIKIFVALGEQKRRPTPLLRAMAFHLSKKEEKIPLKNLIDLVYALNELTFCDPILMAKVSDSLETQIATIESPSVISSLVTSLGRMRYKHRGLSEALEYWISNHIGSLRAFDCAAWLLTSAVLRIPNEDNLKFFETAKSLLNQRSVPNPIEWTNVVHSLAILNQCTPDLLATVLQPQFIKQIESVRGKLTSPIVKLLNLNSLGKNEVVKNYNGPFIQKEYIDKWSVEAVITNDKILSKLVVDTLGNFLPPPKYMKSYQRMESGVYVDAVCLLNEKLDPIPVDSTNVNKDCVKLAVVVLGYPSMCLGVTDPTGITHLHVQILQSEGYQVITVPFSEFNSHEKLVKRVQYLEQKIKSLANIKTTEQKGKVINR